jgi:hypothetical protein
MGLPIKISILVKAKPKLLLSLLSFSTISFYNIDVWLGFNVIKKS